MDCFGIKKFLDLFLFTKTTTTTTTTLMGFDTIEINLVICLYNDPQALKYVGNKNFLQCVKPY